MDKLQHRYEGGVEQLIAIFREIGYDESERHIILEVCLLCAYGPLPSPRLPKKNGFASAALPPLFF